MAIEFPTNPTNGQVFTSGARTWTYNSSKSAWIGGTISNTFPLVGSTNLTSLTISGQVWLQGPQLLSKTTYPGAYAKIGDQPGVSVTPLVIGSDVNGTRNGLSTANGLIIAGFAAGNSIYTSTDGLNWTLISIGASSEAPCLLWIAEWSLYVCSFTGGIWTSPTGSVWTRVVTPSANANFAPIYKTSIASAARVVCPRITIGGVIRTVYSDDGITWTTGSVDTTAMPQTWGGAHTDGRITQGHFTSHDGGVTWSIGTAPMTHSSRVFWNANFSRWIFIGGNYNGTAMIPKLYMAPHATSGALTWSMVQLSSGDGEGGMGSINYIANTTWGTSTGMLLGIGNGFSGGNGSLHHIINNSNSYTVTGVRLPEHDSGWAGLWTIGSYNYAVTRVGKIWASLTTNPFQWHHVGNIPDNSGFAQNYLPTYVSDKVVCVNGDSAYLVTLTGTSQRASKIKTASATEFGLPSISGIGNNPQYIRVS